MSHPLLEIAIATNPEAEDAVAALIERETGQPPGIHINPCTGAITVSTFASLAPRKGQELRGRLRLGISTLGRLGLDPAPGRISLRQVPPRNWGESWKRHFKPIDIAGRLLVKPTWNRRHPRVGQALVLLDPGMSFGTGQHATTRFCLEQLVSIHRSGAAQSMLDAGTGSGILAIAAVKLGYERVEAFDFDPDCVRTTRANAVLNRIGHLEIREEDVTQLPRRPAHRFDVVCANLMHDLLIAQCGRLAARVAPRGSLVLAGILTTQFDRVAQAYRASGWEIALSRTEAEWRSAVFRRATM